MESFEFVDCYKLTGVPLITLLSYGELCECEPVPTSNPPQTANNPSREKKKPRYKEPRYKEPRYKEPRRETNHRKNQKR